MSRGYTSMFEFRKKLPAYKQRRELIEMVNKNQVVVVSGETGCGKTTQVPQFILEDALESGRGSKCREDIQFCYAFQVADFMFKVVRIACGLSEHHFLFCCLISGYLSPQPTAATEVKLKHEAMVTQCTCDLTCSFCLIP